jgi:carbon-monoxide dehydrogenase small subunit
MSCIEISVNGRARKLGVEDNLLLVEMLRERLELTGTHVGCDTSQCGSCVVRLNGDTVKSCSVLAATIDGAEITTIEGVATGSDLHPMQKAFSECHALQCGYCTPGLVITAIDIVEKSPGGLTAAAVVKELKGNICRCTGYVNIVAAILKGAADMGVPIHTEEDA